MRVVIIGGGLIGLTSAHYLAAAGAAVTLLDSAPVPAAGLHATLRGHRSHRPGDHAELRSDTSIACSIVWPPSRRPR